ncbi:transmembrane protein 234 homolog [Myzus persicae]|uniref:transmembrane protein 234 homolog n=1 Tax=Myzus persicae TaxID=13164 RepID=UPI000B9318B9|nr:transmembrane protein 234 homolog [Myzus persicae]
MVVQIYNVSKDTILQLFIVGVLWGSTNPFLKAATNKVKRNKTFNLISEVTDHITNWHYLIPFLINQCGSLLFYFTLKYSDISLAVPIANGVSLVSTSIVGTLIGEEKPKLRTMVGILFLLFGIFCLIIDKKL